jgi:hypothetical protein
VEIFDLLASIVAFGWIITHICANVSWLTQAQAQQFKWSTKAGRITASLVAPPVEGEQAAAGKQPQLIYQADRSTNLGSSPCQKF